jgi:dTDP-4-dehydrorhamnose reductase
MKTVLILSKGYVSSKINEYWTDNSVELVSVSRNEADYLNAQTFKSLVELYKPEYIVNCY